MMRSPNKPCGRTSREQEGQHIGEPVLDTATEKGSEKDLRQLLAGPRR